MTSDFDRLRAWMEERLSPSEAADLERAIANNPELRALAAEMRDVWALTAVSLGSVPPTRLTAESVLALDVERTRARRWRRVAAIAATIAALIGIGYLVAARRDRAPKRETPLVLQSIPSEAAVAAPSLFEQDAELLASYAPVENGEIRWLDSLETGRALASAAGRPVFVFGGAATCPWCIEMRAEALRDPAVVELFRNFVPVQLDLMAMGLERAQPYLERGYPFLEVEDSSGNALYSMHGKWDSDEFRTHLERALSDAAIAPRAPTWERTRQLAVELQAALADERAGRLGGAFERFQALLTDGKGSGLAAEGERGAARIGGSARAVLAEARDLARTDVAAARHTLVAALERFEPSPYARDFGAVLERMDASGRFPEIAAR
jgi:hypothetical protein